LVKYQAPKKQPKWNLSQNHSSSETAHESLPYNCERGKNMEKKMKKKKIIPSDIPIVWVNIVDTETDESTIL
jgi:hypothetical protein